MTYPNATDERHLGTLKSLNAVSEKWHIEKQMGDIYLGYKICTETE